MAARLRPSRAELLDAMRGHVLAAGELVGAYRAPEAIEPLALEINAAVRRQLAGEPFACSDRDLPWDVRTTGSAAIECAFVAAGLLRIAWFARPNIRDVAGGVPLVQPRAARCGPGAARGWASLERLEVADASRLRS
jgi:fructose-1,6-bisphosphatase/inositol monophosphatase family enzyme